MHTKNNSVANVLIVSVLVLAASFSISFYFSKPQAVALANSEPVQQIPTVLPVESSVTPQNISQKALSNTKKDITVDITSTQVISTGIEIGICYTTPDNGEWYPMPGHLFYGEYEVYPDEYEFTFEKLADGKNTGTRCALIRYRIDDLRTLNAPINFSIVRFYAPGREMYTPCQELQQRLDTNPKANAYGLKANCTDVGDGTISVTLIDHNPTVTKDKASKMLDEIAGAEVDGPWEFTITEIAK